MIIMSLIFFFNYGTLDFLSLKEIEYLLGILIILAGITKRAQIPFSA